MMNSALTDKELINQFIQGKEIALEGLISRHKEKVYTQIMMFVKDRSLADDIFQDTFIKVIKTLRSGTYTDEGKFGPWVARIAYNLCVDHFRKSKRNPSISGNDDFDIFDVIQLTDENIEDKITRDETNSKVRQLIDALPEEQKQVVILRHFSEMSFKEISEITGVSINTALGRMRYALINMRKTIDEKQINI